MKNLELYLNSLTKGGRAKVDDILEQNKIFNKEFIDGDISGSGDIEFAKWDRFSLVEPRDLNQTMSDIEFSHNKMWSTVLSVDSAIRSLSKRVDESAELLNKTNNKLHFAYDKIKSKVNDNSYRKVYTENFSDYSGTDRDQTTAEIFGGKLTMAQKEVSSEIENWDISYLNSAGDDENRICIAVSHQSRSPISNEVQDFTGDGLLMKASKSFYPNLSTSGISFTAGQKFKVEKIVITDNLSQQTVVASGITAYPGLNKINFDKTYNCKEITIYIRQYLYRIAHEEYHANPGTVYIQAEQFNRNIFNSTWIMLRNMYRNVAERTQYYIYDVSISNIKLYESTLLQKSEWVSEPIKIQGTINEITIDADVVNGSYGNVRWYISSDGSRYIPIVENQTVENELLEFDSSFIANTVYPVDTTKQSTSNIEYDITENLDGTTSIVASKPFTGLASLSYETTYTGAVKLDELGVSSESSKLKEATSNGQKGERFATTKLQTIVLSNKPEGEIEVYADGIKCTKLPSDKSFSDLAEDIATVSYVIYYNIDGEFIKFSKDVRNIVVYYFYKESTVRIKAVLTSLQPYSGNSPEVNQLNISLGGTL